MVFFPDIAGTFGHFKHETETIIQWDLHSPTRINIQKYSLLPLPEMLGAESINTLNCSFCFKKFCKVISQTVAQLTMNNDWIDD